MAALCKLLLTDWIKELGDWLYRTTYMMPGPYPKTPEERAAAAKKYNMRVEDYEGYEPHPGDGIRYDKTGDSQCTGTLTCFSGSVLTHPPPVVHWYIMCNHFFLFIGFVLFMFWLGEMYPSYMPVGLEPSCLGGEK
uniref:Uncharacterized protein n=1 Tax=Chelonoidis abingdonii TaxID=106734 RepID=A0A8C0HFK0_CHEAB